MADRGQKKILYYLEEKRRVLHQPIEEDFMEKERIEEGLAKWYNLNRLKG